MKGDDAELQKKLKEIAERSKKIDELRVAVIKGHLIVEETLDAFIEASLFNPEQLKTERLNFHTKGSLALSLSLQEDQDQHWSVFWAVNQLRNKIAHKLDSEEIEEKMKFLRNAYIRTLSSKQAEHAEKLSDKEIVDAACYLTAGFLATLAQDAKTRRRIIDEHWKPRG